MKFLLIGGCKTSNVNNNIEQFIKSIDNNLLYVALASQKYEQSYINFIQKIGFVPPILTINDLNNENYIKKILSASSFYFAGGCANDLIARCIKYDLVKYFYRQDVKLLAGISAGGIMLASYGMGDRDAFIDNKTYYNFKMLKGLGLLDVCFCPHYQKEGLEIFDDEVKKYGKDAYALEDETAILFEDKKPISIIKNDFGMSCYCLSLDNDYQLIPLYERNL